MKRRFLFVVITLVMLLAVSLVWLHQREYQRESYQGRHARDWAWVLLTSQTDQSGSNHNEAIAALRALGPRAIPPLRRMLAERDKFYEQAIVQAAHALPVSQRIALIRQLHPGQALASRLAAISALGLLGTNGAEAIPDLCRAMKEPIAQIRWDAARALVMMGEPGIHALVAAVADTNALVRIAAILVLAEAPTNAQMVGPSVMNALVDSDDSVRAAAVYAAGRLSLDAMPLLLAQLNSTNPAIQVASLRALAGLRPGGRQVSTNVMMIANASTGELRRQAIETLGMLPVATSNAATVVMIALDDSDPAIRLTAIRAVGAMNWKTRAAIPRLIEFARSPAAIEREAAVVALAEFGSRASNGVPAITLLLEDSELRVRAAATNALGRINSPANQLP